MGVGAGYSVKSELDNIRVNNIELDNQHEHYGTSVIACNCDIDCDATIKNASSYYEGADINITTPCKITYIEVQLFYKQDIESIFGVEDADEIDIANFNKDAFIDYLESLFYNGVISETGIGMGYIHTKYNGQIANRKDYGKEYPTELISLEATISDTDIINYVDKVVTGEDLSTTYSVFLDDDISNEFEEEDEAIDYAKELYEEGDGDIKVVMEVFREDFEGNWDLDYDEVVWSSTRYEEEILGDLGEDDEEY